MLRRLFHAATDALVIAFGLAGFLAIVIITMALIGHDMAPLNAALDTWRN